MKKLVFFSILFLLATQSKAQTSPYWQWLGPSDSEQVDQVYASGDTIYAGTNWHLWGSFDAGKSWAVLDGGLGSGRPNYAVIHWLSVGASNSSLIYMSKASWVKTIWGLLYMSTNAGKSWMLLTDTTNNNSPLSQYYSGVSRIAVSPYDTSIVFADVSVGVLSDDKLYRSTDGGASWTFVTAGFPVSDHGLTIQFAFDPSDSMKMYATGNDYLASCLFYVSTDGGITWTGVSPCPGRLGFFMTGTTWDILGWGGQQIISSTDEGYTWNGPINASYHNFNVDDMQPTPTFPQAFYAACDHYDSLNAPDQWGVYRSTDSLKSWTLLDSSKYLPLFDYNLDWHSRVFIDRLSGSLYVTSAQGLYKYYKPVTGIHTVSGPPSQFILYSNYPNPFNPSTIVRYDLPKTSKVLIEVYNVLGQKVEKLEDKTEQAGTHEVTFHGSRFPSGIYLCRIETHYGNRIIKMMLLK